MDGISNLSRPDMSSVNNTATPSSAPRENRSDLHNKHNPIKKFPKIFQVGYIVLLVGVVVLIVGLILLFSFNHVGQESSLIDKNDYQSIFVNVTGSNGGQAYFGHIISLNTNYIVLNDVFYLQPGSVIQSIYSQ